MTERLLCKRVSEHEPFVPPATQRSGDAGLDLSVSRYACVSPGAMAHLSTNVAIQMPRNVFGMIVPRSSTMWRKGLHVSTGIIDNGYRGELMVLVRNMTERSVIVNPGERIAQLLLLPLLRMGVAYATTLSEGNRGDKGFGSTGGYDD